MGAWHARYRWGMGRRGHVLWSTAILVTACVVGCAPQSAPSPSPSGTASPFSSDAEAFAAAEATYRAYVDALNQVDLAKPDTFEAVYELTNGDANEKARAEFSSLQAQGLVVGGSTRVASVEASAASTVDEVQLLVCADVSQVTLTDANGQSKVSPDRPPVQPLTVRVLTGLRTPLITNISGREGPPLC